MYTYRRLKRNEVIATFGGIDVIANCTDWAVFTPEGTIAKSINQLSGKVMRSVFRLKEAARRECEYQNSLIAAQKGE